jgi:hypothetical protein
LAQQSHIHFYEHADIDTTDVEMSRTLRLRENYPNPDSSFNNPCWLTAEKRRYKEYNCKEFR